MANPQPDAFSNEEIERAIPLLAANPESLHQALTEYTDKIKASSGFERLALAFTGLKLAKEKGWKAEESVPLIIKEVEGILEDPDRTKKLMDDTKDALMGMAFGLSIAEIVVQNRTAQPISKSNIIAFTQRLVDLVGEYFNIVDGEGIAEPDSDPEKVLKSILKKAGIRGGLKPEDGEEGGWS